MWTLAFSVSQRCDNRESTVIRQVKEGYFFDTDHRKAE